MRATPPGQFLGSVKHRSTSPEWVVTELRHAVARQVPAHEHRWACLTLLLGGEYAERPGERWVARGVNTLVVRPALAPHADRIGAAGAWFLTVEVSPSLVARREGCCLEDWSVRQDAGLAGTGWGLFRELRRESPDPGVIGGYIEALVAGLVPGRQASRRPPAWLTRALERLHDAPADAVTLDGLAAECGVHPAHFTRVFRHHVGQTLGTYLRQLRLSAAMRRLAEPGTTPARAALEAGFYDQSHLTRTVRSSTGLTPGQYRREARSIAG